MLGVVLRTRADAAPGTDAAFLVADSSLIVQAVSEHAEKLLGVREVDVVNRHVAELLIQADAEAAGTVGLAQAITTATAGDEEPMRVFVRPASAFGIRIPARIAACGPPAAALLVLD
jgi:hypothetical protein